MIKLNFYLKSDKINHLEASPIYLKMSYKGNSTTISTRKYISKERWKATNKLRNPLRIAKEKNMKLAIDMIAEEIESIYYDLIKLEKDITVIDVKNKYNGTTDKQKEIDVLYLFDIHDSFFEKRVINGERSKASLQKYRRAKALLSSFIKKHYRKNSFPYNKIDSSFIHKLEQYLKYESTYKYKKGIGKNSVVKYFKAFKTICKHAIKFYYVEKNPFNMYDGKLDIEDAVFLTQVELDLIEKKDLSNERLERVRDIFLFSVYTSYAPIDVANLTTSNLITDGSGQLWIITNRAKTKTKSNVPVLPPVKRIIEKYSKINGDKLLPKISNQKINAYLKEIADVCGVQKKLTHYVARHTFATTIALGNDVSIENISSMMGHKRISTTQHYAKVLDKQVKKDMEKLMEKFN